MKSIGITEEEQQAEHTVRCRQIVQEILKFGVNEKQKIKIIQLLSLELENREMMNALSKMTKDYLNDSYKGEKAKKIITLD